MGCILPQCNSPFPNRKTFIYSNAHERVGDGIPHKEKLVDDELQNATVRKHISKERLHMLLGGQVPKKNVDLKQGTDKDDRTQKQQDLA